MKDEQNDYLIFYVIKEMVYQALINGFKRNGIEGTEELIKRNLEGKQREIMLKGYKELIFGKRT